MNRYLNNNPDHVKFLDMARLEVGFKVNFFAMNVEDIDAVPGTAATRAKYALQEAISRLERLATDTSKTDDAKNEAAKTLFKNVTKEVAQSIKTIRSYGEREAEAAKNRAFDVLAPDATKGSIYTEVRQYCREQAAKGDPDFPAKLSQMVRTDIDVARAISAAPGFLSGIGDDRRMHLVTNALEAFAPDDVAHMNHALEVGKQADRMEAGLNKLGQAMFNSALADRASYSRVDVDAPLVAPEAGE
ncbi:hypothetical protein [Sulfitobacter pontiacus]|jgi:hypothetical protein|uniref:hypothetical protein n=1 Tax=Sulfitobacter pontiacus TaxID=60137 RepID=UPI00259A42CA|nr:hypothetical protein [uncultured Sulfitobacter sp.]